jgi:ABC-type glycerol-3-phosphate transport system substrate-binding protein
MSTEKSRPTSTSPAINRRRFLKAAVTTAGAAVLGAACAPAQPGAQPAAKAEPTKATAATTAPIPTAAPAAGKAQTNLKVWWRINPNTQGAISVFEQQHPDVKIELGDLGEAVYGTPKYVTAVAAGKGPDVSYQNRHTFGQFASRKLYRPIEELMKRDGIRKEDFMAGPIQDLTWQGTLYGLPHTAGTRYFFWNRKHFEEAGLDPDQGPETWEDIEAYAAKLNKKSGDKFERYGFLPNFPPGLSDQLLIWAMENGGTTTDPEGRNVLIDSDPWVEALTWCVDVVDRLAGGYASAASFMEGFSGQPIDPFAQNKVSMCSYGNWMIETYARMPDVDYDGMGAMPVPAKHKGKKVNWSCGWTFVIDPNTKLVEEGWKFIKWVIGPEYVKATGTVGMQLQTQEWERQKLPGKPVYAPTPPVYKPAMEFIQKEYYSILPDRQKKMMERYLESEDFAVGCGKIAGLAAAEMWTGFKNAWEAALTKKSSPKEALAAAKADVQKALDEAWKERG